MAPSIWLRTLLDPSARRPVCERIEATLAPVQTAAADGEGAARNTIGGEDAGGEKLCPKAFSKYCGIARNLDRAASI